MLIGVPKEIKDHEYRVGLTPAGAHALVQHGHEVLVETEAGARVGFPDAEYQAAGRASFAGPPRGVGCRHGGQGQGAAGARVWSVPGAARSCSPTCTSRPSPSCWTRCLRAGVSGIAYETVTDARGGLPLLAPMSRIAGKLSIQFGAWALQMANGGSGVLLGGVPGRAARRAWW